MSRHWLAMLLPILLLAGCSDAGDDSGTTGALTADEAQQLNDAAAMLDMGNRRPCPATAWLSRLPNCREQPIQYPDPR